MVRSKTSRLAAVIGSTSTPNLSAENLHKHEVNTLEDEEHAEDLSDPGEVVMSAGRAPVPAELSPSGVLDAASWKQWELTLNHCVKAIVSIKVNLVASFDTERATSSQVRGHPLPHFHPPVPSLEAHLTPKYLFFFVLQASGFVVDAARGIIITNRHVVSPNPITAEAVFYDHEEVPIWPIYRDPVHDFG